MAILFGALTNDLVHLLIWVVVVFISIIVHELGHALVMRVYRQESRIVLYLAGGLTIPESVRWGNGWADVSLGWKQEILISLAGPFAGFLLAGLVMLGVVATGGTITMTAMFGVVPMPIGLLPVGGRVVNLIVMTFLWVNVFWGLINLMPVYPLDGGNVIRQLFIKFDPWDGIRKSLWISVIAGVIVAGAGILLVNSMYIAFLFLILAIEGYQTLQGRIGSNY